jgi:hypothetical protein
MMREFPQTPLVSKKKKCLFLGFDFSNWQISFFEKFILGFVYLVNSLNLVR